LSPREVHDFAVGERCVQRAAGDGVRIMAAAAQQLRDD
jgi:hypothetical protein